MKNDYNMVENLTEAEQNKLIRVFSKWERNNLEITHGKREYTAEDTYGLAYTSSSSYAALWNVNALANLNDNELLHFDGITLNTDLVPVAIFTLYNEDGEELKPVFLPMQLD